jgi:hypothetical protein
MVFFQCIFKGQPYAVKRIYSNEINPSVVWKEKTVHMTLDHVNVVKLYAAWVETDYFFLQELCWGMFDNLIGLNKN